MFKTLKTITLTAIITLYAFSAIACAASLKVTHSSTMPPLSFINENGNPDGILIDLWKEWSHISGINVAFELKNWTDAVSATMSGKADINAGLFYSEKRSRDLIFGDYLFRMKASLFVNRSLTDSGNFNQDETICGVLKDGYAKNFMERNSPYTPLMSFDSAGEMFLAASENRIKMFVADYPVAIYQMSRLGISDSFECVKTLYERELCPAVSRRAEDLMQTVNEYMAAIPKNRKNALINKWLDPDHEEQMRNQTVVILAFLTFLLLIIAHRTGLKNIIKDFKKAKTTS